MITIKVWVGLGFLFRDLVCRDDCDAVSMVFIIAMVLLLIPWSADIPVTAGLGSCFISISFLIYYCTLN